MDHGKWTAEAACVLPQKVGTQFNVLYDHGDKQVDPENVGTIRSWFGTKLSRDALLADLDIAVVLKNSNQALALIEIEESSVHPKLLLGDVFATLLGDHVTFQGRHDLQVGSWTTLIILGHSRTHQRQVKHFEATLNQLKPALSTDNAKIGQITMDTFTDKSDLTKKIVRLVNHRLKIINREYARFLKTQRRLSPLSVSASSTTLSQRTGTPMGRNRSPQTLKPCRRVLRLLI